MIVVCDTSPICYLLLIDSIELLPQLYEQIIIPEAVRNEMIADKAPIALQAWIVQPPNSFYCQYF